MSQEPTLSTQRIYEGRILNLRLDTVQLPQGRAGKREIVEHGPSVVVAAFDPEGHILLVRQYRKAVEKTLLELPAGGIEQGEDPATAALRELQEETGYVAGHLQALGGFYASPGYCAEYLHLFLATELRFGPQAPAEDEAIVLVKVPMEHALSLVSSGEICDAKSVAGILKASSISRSSPRPHLIPLPDGEG